MHLPEEDVVLAMSAALLHDIGSFANDEPESVQEIERYAQDVSMVSARMLEDLPGFSEVASVIRYCQCSWRDSVACAIEEGSTCERLGRIASIVHVADDASLMLIVDTKNRVLNKVGKILDAIKACSGTLYSPEVVDAFATVAEAEYVWMDLAFNPMFLTYFTGEIATVSLDEVVQLTSLMSRIIDYRSVFTAMHSAGVAASAHELALLAGFTAEDAKKILVAGNLHDVGKLVVPRSILEKPGKLTTDEFNIVKEHPYYTSLVLLGAEGFDDIRKWASRHHEKLHGRGYPFHFGGEALDCGDCIMGVADVFTAITEERPYRSGMPREKVAAILSDSVRNDELNGDLVDLLLDNYDQVDHARDEASRRAGKRYFESLSSEA